MMNFKEIDSSEIKKTYPSYFHEKAQYFKVSKSDDTYCYYGLIDRSCEIYEAFLMFKSFKGKILSKGFFLDLFDHLSNLGYKEVYTWSQWDRLIKLFSHFKTIGIEKVGSPAWDNDPSKTWFVKRI